MTKHFLVSTAAAALIAGTGFAYAQGMSQGASGGSAASQSAPSTSGSADRNVPSSSSDMQAKPTDTYEKTPHENRGARSDMDHDRSKSMQSQSSDPSKSEKNMRSEDRNRKDEDRNQRAEDRDGKSKDRDRNSAERSGRDFGLFQERWRQQQEVNHDHGSGEFRRQAFDRTTQQDHNGHQERKGSASHQCQFLDCGWNPGAANGEFLPSANGNR